MGKHDKDRDKDRKRMKQSQREAKAADKAADVGGHHGAKAHGQPAQVDASPAVEPRRAAGPPRRGPPTSGGRAVRQPEHHAAIDEIGRIEVRIADVERATTPPRG